MPKIESSSESPMVEEDIHTDSHAHTLLSLHSSFAIGIAIGTGERYVRKRRQGKNTGPCVTTSPHYVARPLSLQSWDFANSCLPACLL